MSGWSGFTRCSMKPMVLHGFVVVAAAGFGVHTGPAAPAAVSWSRSASPLDVQMRRAIWDGSGRVLSLFTVPVCRFGERGW